jgi:DNA-binding response OmpR family regulator
VEPGLRVGGAVILGFGDVEIDLDRYELRRAGAVVAIEPRVFDVLAYLAGHRERVAARRSCSTTSGATASSASPR